MDARKGGTVDPSVSESSASVAMVVAVVVVTEDEETARADRRCNCRKTASAASGFRWYRNAYIVLVYISSSS